METSTPITAHREPNHIIMEEDSPNSDMKQLTDSSTSSMAGIPEHKVKAGMSDEVHSMAMTPAKEVSPDTMDRRLALHTINIVNASQNNSLVSELKEDVEHVLDLSLNTFARKESVCKPNIISAIKWSDGEVDMNDVLDQDEVETINLCAGNSKRSVGMDGMNKTNVGAGTSKQSVWYE